MNLSILAVLLAALINVTKADDVPNQNTHLYSIPAEPTSSYNESTETGVLSILPISITSHDTAATTHAATTPSTTDVTPSASSNAAATTTTTAGHVVTSGTSHSGSAATQSPTSNLAANPTACPNNIVGIVALVGLAVAI